MENVFGAISRFRNVRHFFLISDFSTNFSNVDLYMDRTIHIFWYVDVAGGRGGPRGVAGARGGSPGGGVNPFRLGP